MENHAMQSGFVKREPPPGVHVILGDSAAGTFRQAFQARDDLLIDQDVLSCGPTPKFQSAEAWREMRLGYWNSLFADDGEPYVGHTDSVLANLSRLRDAERINLWFATSLSEQLFVAFTLQVIEAAGVALERVHLLPYEQLRGRPRAVVRGMGELNPANMADHPEPVVPSHQVREDYRAAWAAMTSEDPRAFEQFAGVRPDASAWLKQAMSLMLRRFPERRTGLAYWDGALLDLARQFEGRTAARVIGGALVLGGEDGDFVGDLWLFARLLQMGDARLPQPLLTFTGSGPGMRDTQAMLTPFGKDVLEGRASNYPANPIEEWAAGVKLSSSAGTLWFNDGGRLVRA